MDHRIFPFKISFVSTVMNAIFALIPSLSHLHHCVLSSSADQFSTIYN